MLKQVNAAPAFVLPSSKPGQEHAAWLGEGRFFHAAQPVPTLHYMAQPYYLLDHGIDTTTQLDYRLMQRQILALTQMLLDLSRVPSADLRKETAP